MRNTAVWKRLQGDVFRKPARPLLLSLLVGAGMQILLCTILTLCYAFYDFYFDKGAILGFAAAAFPWGGFVNGYTSARIYTFFHGSSWTQMACNTSVFLPCFISACLLIIDTCEWIETGRADSISVLEAAVLAAYWLFIHVPTCFCGAYLGFLRTPIQPPVRRNRMEREQKEEPDCPYYLEIPFTSMGAAFFPSIAMILQLV